MRAIGFLLVALSFGAEAFSQSIPNWSQSLLGNVRAAVFAGGDATTILARRVSPGGPLEPVRSVDGGATWTPFTVFGTKPDRFIASPTDPKVFFALQGGVVNENLFPKDEPSALYRTIDGGMTWEIVLQRFEIGGEPLGHVSVGADPNLLYATRMEASVCSVGCIYESGVHAYRSRDAGKTWQSIQTGLEGATDILLYPSPSDANIVYARAQKRVFRSTDQGSTWRAIGAFGSYQFIHYMAVDNRDPMTVYVRTSSGTELSVTQDGGDTWTTRLGPNAPGPLRRILVDPVQAGRLYFMGWEGEIYESRDRAATWNGVAPGAATWTVGRGVEHNDSNPLLAVKGESRVVIAKDGAGGLRKVEIQPDSLTLGSDLWWNPAESGAGFTITQHASGKVFLVWYRYDAMGNPVWQVVSGGSWLDARTYSGPIYETRGPHYFQQGFDPALVGLSTVGTATLRLSDANNATFAYQLDAGGQGEIPITRQLFGVPVDWQLANFSDLWWNAQQSGWGIAITQQFGMVFATWFVYDAQGRPLWIVLPNGAFSHVLDGVSGIHFIGDIYTTRGPRFGQVFDPAQVEVSKIGTASISFRDRETAVLKYSAFGRSESREITRQPF